MTYEMGIREWSSTCALPISARGKVRVRRPGTGDGSVSIDVSGEPDLELLDSFLTSERAPPGCLGLAGLDGFLTGLLAGPETVMPSEWMPVLWGGEGPTFDDSAEARAITGAILQDRQSTRLNSSH